MDWIEVVNATIIIVISVFGSMEGYSYVQNLSSLENNVMSKSSVIHEETGYYKPQNMPHYIVNSGKVIIKNVEKQPNLSMRRESMFLKNVLKHTSKKARKGTKYRKNNDFRLKDDVGYSFYKEHEDSYVFSKSEFRIVNGSIKMCYKNNKNCIQISKNALIKYNPEITASSNHKSSDSRYREKLRTKRSFHPVSNRKIDNMAAHIRSKKNIKENSSISTPLKISTSFTGASKLIEKVKRDAFLNLTPLSLQYINSSRLKDKPFLNKTNSMTTEMSLSFSDILHNLASELSRLNKTLLLFLTQAVEKSRIQNMSEVSTQGIFPEMTSTPILNNLNIPTDLVQISTAYSTLIRNYTEDESKDIFVTPTSQAHETKLTSVTRKVFFQSKKNESDLFTVVTSPNSSNFSQEKSTLPISTLSYVQEIFSRNYDEISTDIPKLRNVSPEKDHVRSTPLPIGELEETSTSKTSSPIDMSIRTHHNRIMLDEELTPTQISECDITRENSSLANLIENFKRVYPVELWQSEGYFTEQYLYSINPHWLQFPPPPPVNHYVLALLYCVIMVIGMTGNALVVFMFVR